MTLRGIDTSRILRKTPRQRSKVVRGFVFSLSSKHFGGSMKSFSLALRGFGGGFKSARFLVALAVGFLLLCSPSGLPAQPLTAINGTFPDPGSAPLPQPKVI